MRRSYLYASSAPSERGPREKPDQLKQIRRPERAPPGRYLQEGIKRRAVSPAPRQGAQHALIVIEEDTLLAPVLALTDKLELPPRKRMEPMRDTNKSLRRVPTKRI